MNVNVQGLPNTLQVLNISSSFPCHTNDLDISYMKDLRILLCDGVWSKLPILPRSIIWFRIATLHVGEIKYLPVSIRDNDIGAQNIFENGIGYLPNWIGELNNLKIMEITWNMPLMQHQNLNPQNVSLPHSFGELGNLEVLDFGGCDKLTLRLDSYGSLKMWKLKLYNLGISSLPNTIEELSAQLEGLD